MFENMKADLALKAVKKMLTDRNQKGVFCFINSKGEIEFDFTEKDCKLIPVDEWELMKKQMRKGLGK